jgi:glycosyltransferase involved in cell wall biosynthesis
VIAQPLPGGLELELIMVNDGSRDDSWNIIKSLPAKYPHATFQLINKTINEGKGATGWLCQSYRRYYSYSRCR